MATYEKRGHRWRVQLMRAGKRVSATFDTKAEAQAWASDEASAREGKGTRTLDQALSKYDREVTPTKRGERWESLRLDLLRRTLKFRNRPLHEIDSDDFASWRDDRLKQVSGASVRRELTLISSVYQAAILDWKWTKRNPIRDIRKPPKPRDRTRVIAEAEADELVLALGYAGGEPQNVSQRVAVAFLFALETAMRAGEIAGIRESHIRGRVVHLPQTKNGEPRDVPLTSTARALLDLCPKGFGLTTAQMDALFRKARAKAAKANPKLAEIHFHDSRRTATIMLSKKLQPMELAKVTGHRDLKTLLNVYYGITADDLASKLD